MTCVIIVAAVMHPGAASGARALGVHPGGVLSRDGQLGFALARFFPEFQIVSDYLYLLGDWKGIHLAEGHRLQIDP